MSIEIIWFSLLCLGVLVAELVTGRPKGPLSSLSDYPNQKMPSMFIGFGVSKMERAYHIHHWVWAAIISIVLIALGYLVWAAFFCGITLQGLTYGDRFMFKVESE
jgi:hypothetical protein